jgi:hypothetical protein
MPRDHEEVGSLQAAVGDAMDAARRQVEGVPVDSPHGALLSCMFCGAPCELRNSALHGPMFWAACSSKVCGYRGGARDSKMFAIVAHNQVRWKSS